MYFAVIRTNFLRTLAYPFDAVLVLVLVVLELCFLILFWSIVGASSEGTLQVEHLVAYFLCAKFVSEVTMCTNLRYGGTITNRIKNGTISSFMVRPLDLTSYLYADIVGTYVFGYLLYSIGFVAGLILSPPASVLNLLLFVLALASSALISFALNLGLGIVALYTVDASMFRWSLNHIVRLLSGVLVPLWFFPGWAQGVLRFSPFPAMVYGPVHALQAASVTPELLQELAVSVAWAVVLPTVIISIWNISLRRYEAVGI